MTKTLGPFRFLLIGVAGWMNQQQQYAIEYLREENRILRGQLGSQRLRLTHLQHRVVGSSSFPMGCGFENGVVTRFSSTCAELETISA